MKLGVGACRRADGGSAHLSPRRVVHTSSIVCRIPVRGVVRGAVGNRVSAASDGVVSLPMRGGADV